MVMCGANPLRTHNRRAAPAVVLPLKPPMLLQATRLTQALPAGHLPLQERTASVTRHCRRSQAVSGLRGNNGNQVVAPVVRRKKADARTTTSQGCQTSLARNRRGNHLRLKVAPTNLQQLGRGFSQGHPKHRNRRGRHNSRPKGRGIVQHTWPLRRLSHRQRLPQANHPKAQRSSPTCPSKHLQCQRQSRQRHPDSTVQQLRKWAHHCLPWRR
mmetsp:Transcript_27378/g.63899  ORF Transcript_27378/g.63899 Transcript_27378/m.63899 type:complete len:213 (-) Transcript_27378:766-1404(-)